MEIYKLTDKMPVKTGDELVITGLKAGVKNPERVNVLVNGKYELSLDVAQVVELGVRVGKVISAEELAELKRASEFGKMYQRALEWVLVRPRSVRETKDYLYRKFKKSSSDTLKGVRPASGSSEGFSELSEQIISRLVSRGYLDDEKFARWWAENRFVKKGVSQKRLRMELAGKGVEKETIDEVLGGRNDREEIQKILAKKRAKYDDPKKLMAYLCRQGFPYELVREMME